VTHLERLLALSGPRHVRPAEGARLYDQPVGSVIHRDLPAPRVAAAVKVGAVSRVAAVGKKSPAGMRPASDEDRKRFKIPPNYRPAFVVEGEPVSVMWRGYDSKGRVKTEYTAEYKAGQAAKKFNRIVALNHVIERLDASVERDALTNDTAAALLLMRRTAMRPGSMKDTGAEKQAYGATTLLRKHASVDAGAVTFKFVGKNGKDLTITSDDAVLVKAVEARLSGDPEGRLFTTSETRTNAYLKRATGDSTFKQKDLRTYYATAMALALVSQSPKPATKGDFLKRRQEVARAVSAKLGNTPIMALNAYINPAAFDPWVDGSDWLP
jgi:DNA topoisomerase-1